LRDITHKLAELVACDPSAPAIIDTSKTLSYAELDTWSNALAHKLNEVAGPKPRVCIVVAGFDHTAIVGMVAVLKTPHIFVALDCESPPDNIAEIADQLEAGLCLHTAQAMETVQAAKLSIPIIEIDALPNGPVPVTPTSCDLTRLACYKRSSGSTGGAKTAMYSIEALLIDAEQGAKVNDIEPGALYAVLSTFDSAMSAGAILRCLLAGGTLLPVDLRFETPTHASTRLIELGMTHIHSTPTAFRLLALGLPPGDIFPDVHSVFLSGEKTSVADVRLLSKVTRSDCRLRAAFSSSETQLVAHTTVLPANKPDLEELGKLIPFPDVKIEILDENGQLRPIGEHGQIRVVSKMVSLGYYGSSEPAFTTRFKTLENGSRSFLTDDIGHLTKDGRLVMISRTGHEVKIRGRRVNLTELQNFSLAGTFRVSDLLQRVQLQAEHVPPV